MFKAETLATYCPLNRLLCYGATSKAAVEIIETGDVSLLLSTSIDAIRKEWQRTVSSVYLSLQAEFLQTLEENAPRDFQFQYVLFRKKDEIIGAAYFQVVQFRAKDHLQADNTAGFWKKRIAELAQFRILVLGNMLLTGNHSSYFKNNIYKKEQENYLLQAIKTLEKRNRTSITMVKDLIGLEEYIDLPGFYPMEFQPTMQLDLRADWNTFDDYLGAMKSKYRVRARRAFKKCNGLIFKSLSVKQLQLFEEDLYELYQQVVGDAGFNMVALHPEHFTNLKKALGDKCEIIGCFAEDRLLGFYTLLHNGEELEAHYLGFDQDANREYQLYLNMLYRMVEYGIEKKFKTINFARTAMEIKSSVGAIAKPTYILIRHRNLIAHYILPKAIRYMEPKEEWQPRHPFTAEQ